MDLIALMRMLHESRGYSPVVVGLSSIEEIMRDSAIGDRIINAITAGGEIADVLAPLRAAIPGLRPLAEAVGSPARTRRADPESPFEWRAVRALEGHRRGDQDWFVFARVGRCGNPRRCQSPIDDVGRDNACKTLTADDVIDNS
jgi:hypothetical protein